MLYTFYSHPEYKQREMVWLILIGQECEKDKKARKLKALKRRINRDSRLRRELLRK